jgi:hypothetical protein
MEKLLQLIVEGLNPHSTNNTYQIKHNKAFERNSVSKE